MAKDKEPTVELQELRSSNDRIKAAYAEMKDAEAVLKTVHAKYRNAKLKHDAAVASLAATVGQETMPHLFNQNIEPGEPVPAGDATWRNDDISALGLEEKIATKLREHGVNTMGVLSDRISGLDGAEPLTKIPGLGQKMYEAILTAEEVYDSKRQKLTAGSGKKPSKKKPAKAAGK